MGKQLEYSRDNLRLLLVYNASCNPMDYRTKTALARAKRGLCDYTHFGLGNLREFCFKDVKTYTEEEFEEFVSDYMAE